MIYFFLKKWVVDIYNIILSSSGYLAVMIAAKKDIIDLILSIQSLYNIMYNVVDIYNMYIIHQTRIVWRTWATRIGYSHNRTTVYSSIERDLGFSGRFPIWRTRFFSISFFLINIHTSKEKENSQGSPPLFICGHLENIYHLQIHRCLPSAFEYYTNKRCICTYQYYIHQLHRILTFTYFIIIIRRSFEKMLK